MFLVCRRSSKHHFNQHRHYMVLSSSMGEYVTYYWFILHRHKVSWSSVFVSGIAYEPMDLVISKESNLTHIANTAVSDTTSLNNLSLRHNIMTLLTLSTIPVLGVSLCIFTLPYLKSLSLVNFLISHLVTIVLA